MTIIGHAKLITTIKNKTKTSAWFYKGMNFIKMSYSNGIIRISHNEYLNTDTGDIILK